MRALTVRFIPVLIGLNIFLSVLALLLNYFIYHFPGNNYFPENAPLAAILLILFYLGSILYYGRSSRLSLIGKELLYFFCIMSVIALATNAVQLTPFSTIDHYIHSFETKIGIDLINIISWTNQTPSFKYVLGCVYDSLPYQMSILPMFIIAMGRFQTIRNYYFLMLTSTLIGFLFYYFFPTTAPASVITSPLFSNDQIATGLKFTQIHHHLIPSTNAGGLIALPSFHTIWALLCIYLLKDWKIPCIVLMIINFLLIASCVLLGWHYFLDILAGFLVVGLSYYLLIKCKDQTLLNSPS